MENFNPTQAWLSDIWPNFVFFSVLILTESVKMRVAVSEIVTQVSLRLSGMFLLIRSCQWVPVAEDEMNVICTSAFVWAKHNGVWCGIIKLTLETKNTFSLCKDARFVRNCVSDGNNARTKRSSSE